MHDLIDTEPDQHDGVADDPLAFEAVIAPERWQEPGDYYRTMSTDLRRTVEAVVEADTTLRRHLRREIPSLIRVGRLLAFDRADPTVVEQLQRKRLYTGGVAAVDGTHSPINTISMVGAQIGVIRVGYQGATGQAVMQLRQCGLSVPRTATVADIRTAVESRSKLPNLLPARYVTAIRNYKEREMMLTAGPDVFKVGHGPLISHEMLIGGGRRHILQPCLQLIGQLIDDGAYAMIVSSANDTTLRMLGMSLEPGEYLIVDDGTAILGDFLHGTDEDGEMRAHYTATPRPEYGGKSQVQIFTEFMGAYGSRFVRRVMRAHRSAPPYVFYCNLNRYEEAVHMLFADAANTGARGFPLLVDLADQMCSSSFKAGDYARQVDAEFARAAGSGIYAPEHATRDYVG